MDYEIVQELWPLWTDSRVVLNSLRERPEEYVEQKKYYSGKRKPLLKSNYCSTHGQDIIVDVIAENQDQKWHNFFICQIQRFLTPIKSFKVIKVILEKHRLKPYEKPKKGELISFQIENKRNGFSFPTFVEHLIRVVKIFRVSFWKI